MAIMLTDSQPSSLTSNTALLRLLQLSSVSLPVGGYAFSQGLEYAIDVGWVRNSDQVEDWIQWQLSESIAHCDLPILFATMQTTDPQQLNEYNDLILACRETKELRLTDTAMGEALYRLLTSLSIETPFHKSDDISFVVLFAIAAKHWQIPFQTAALGFCWSWLENQIAAATKLVPLGQTQAQILLGTLQHKIPNAIDVGRTIDTDDVGAGLPCIAIASARHETQYSRLFRS